MDLECVGWMGGDHRVVIGERMGICVLGKGGVEVRLGPLNGVISVYYPIALFLWNHLWGDAQLV